MRAGRSGRAARANRWLRGWFRRVRYGLPFPHLGIRLGRRRARRGPGRRLLLVVGDALMGRHLEALWRLFRGDARLSFAVTSTGRGGRGAPARREAERMGLPFVGRRASRRRWWDLVVVADHHAAHRYPRLVPALRIQHALAEGKRWEGSTYRYDPRRVLRPDGTPLYDRIFEASERSRDRALAACPALAGRIAVVGDLFADALLARRGEREGARRGLGLGPEERLVLLCSTWGRPGLVERHGEPLVEQALRLQAEGGWRFALSAHPRQWRSSSPPGDRGPAWLKRVRARGLAVLAPDEDWIPWYVASDAMVADHTSMAAMYALLGRPLLFVPPDEDALDRESSLARLHGLVPPVAPPARLGPALRDALARYPLPALREIAREILACPGEAAARTRREVYDLVGLPAP